MVTGFEPPASPVTPCNPTTRLRSRLLAGAQRASRLIDYPIGEEVVGAGGEVHTAGEYAGAICVGVGHSGLDAIILVRFSAGVFVGEVLQPVLGSVGEERVDEVTDVALIDEAVDALAARARVAGPVVSLANDRNTTATSSRKP